MKAYIGKNISSPVEDQMKNIFFCNHEMVGTEGGGEKEKGFSGGERCLASFPEQEVGAACTVM